MSNDIVKPNNIFCVGRNYAQHALELKNDIPEEPMIFMKPTHAIAYTEGEPIAFQTGQGEIHYEIELVLYIGKEVTSPIVVNDVVTKMALGIDFTLRDVQTKLKQKGHPWLKAKGFSNSAVLTPFWEFPGIENFEKTTFQLIRQDQVVQSGKAHQMIFDIQTLLTFIHDHVGLKEGDIIFTGTPAGVGAIQDNDAFRMEWNYHTKGSFTVTL